MNETNPTSPASNDSELKEQIASLRALVVNLQLAVIAFVWIVGIFLFIQVYRLHKEVKTVRPQVTQIIESGKREDVAVGQFIGKLSEFSRTNPDILPLLSRYGIQPATAPSAPQKSAAAPAKPATAPATKK